MFFYEENVGKRTILPSSFIGSRRDLTQRYEDGMTIVFNDGKPDIFLTMTCNPSWNEISSELGILQLLQGHPDLLGRIFKAKFEQLKKDVINKGVIGKVKEDYDSIIRAEIPKIEQEPQLYTVVLKHMIHGPCGTSNPRSPCMKNGKCKKRYPKQFLDDTRQGPDRVAIEVHRGSTLDEVQQYIDARWICAPEALNLWNEFYPHMVEDYPSTSTSVSINMINMLLKDLNNLLIQHGKQLTNFDLPSLTFEDTKNTAIPRVIQEELAIQVPNEDVDSIKKLNHDQFIAFNAILDVINHKQSQVFFVDEPGTKAQMILACIIKSPLWVITKVLHLRQNMQSLQDPTFVEYLMRIGDGIEPTKYNDIVKIPHQLAITWEGESSIQKLIQETFSQLESHTWDATYMVQRAILTPKNDDVQQLNNMIINQFPGKEHEFLSFYEVEGDTHNLYQQEFLHTIAPGGLPPHVLKIKKSAPLMLLRNIDPKSGLCNGTRLLCRGFFRNMLDVEILIGTIIGKKISCLESNIRQ
ncbi:hypothetical protein VNO78_34991 [Psophocarpus tetragonolobus]|uniref:DNA helicase n=1 Tax=Psophocarpus tetragonolobus TaxID=3891 RepID=A0AAN9NNR7_PSOTE